VPFEGGETLTLRLTVPEAFVKSPQQLGLNDDVRPLTIAVRAIALCALELR
jgi:hypothetical protein